MMARKAARKTRIKRERPAPTAVYSIKTFCEAFGFSEGFFFKLLKLGTGPDVMRVGSRTMITHAAAERWCQAREQAAGRRQAR